MGKEETADREVIGKLPPGAAISWGLVKPPKRGPKREMSIQQIVAAAVDLADKEGLGAVSMNRVAAELGYTAMSLYRYIPSKNDLLLLMQEAVCTFEVPAEREQPDWRQDLRDYVAFVVDTFVSHPWFGDVPISSIPITPNNLDYVDWVMRTLRDFPLNDFEKMSILLLLSSYARAVGIIQRDMRRALAAGTSSEEFMGADYGEALKQLVKPDRYPNLYPMIMSGIYTGEMEMDNPVPDDFDFGLERILDGIEAYLAARQGRP
ncbi:TetR/AcrR family transcriptional regulator [Paenibacillus sp. NFR01]|uniref:TetR/AcrR family transcriptional regulator n=1 Tax=Paenibacillus sp. NFR01 TaxID=1566279 RepID=UPI0008BBC3AF|nr:TetR/AcrR family transcriptional regulator [Paenibacillus sp. NFR01]SET49981.1 transcriptional regulator, TetR family [Paenibacillus sp. NFR01]